MISIAYETRAGVASVFPLLSLLAVAACSADDTGGTGASGGVGGTGAVASGGVSNGLGGSAAGGAQALATGGTSSSTGGFASGGIGSGTGGFATGGINNGTGGLATGGISNGTGGLATGGNDSGTGGLATGGIDAGTGGLATGGSDGGSGGLDTGGNDSGTAGSATGGSDDGSGGGDTGGSSGDGGAGTGGNGSGSDPVLHIFMLMGQSNMAGVAAFQASDQNDDERLLVLGGCNQPAGQWNIANPPLNDCPGEKGWNPSNSVGPGMWFAKTLAEVLPEGATVGLVGTAESGESINTFISGGSHHQMILNKIEMAKQAENGRFAGIIFHQGESDNGQADWPGKVVQLYNEVKAAFGVDYDVPFILGELPAGGCCSLHNDLVHEAADPDHLPMGYWVSQDGTNVMDQYHFDHASVVLMGQRYGETMIEALGW